MAVRIVLRGNSGSGKTALSKRLQEALGPNTMRISHDTVRMEILNVRGEEGVRRSTPLLIELLRYGRAHSAVTILEGILPSSAYAPLFAAAADLFGAESLFAYYYDLPFAETLARHATKPNRADFGEAEMRRWWQGRDLVASLRETVFGPELSLEEAAAQVLRDVRGE